MWSCLRDGCDRKCGTQLCDRWQKYLKGKKKKWLFKVTKRLPSL